MDSTVARRSILIELHDGVERVTLRVAAAEQQLAAAPTCLLGMPDTSAARLLALRQIGRSSSARPAPRSRRRDKIIRLLRLFPATQLVAEIVEPAARVVSGRGN
jgi:hypothetical protein